MSVHEEQLATMRQRVRDAFISFEHKEGSRTILAPEIANVLRGMGYNPTEAQEQQLRHKLEMAGVIDDANHIALEHYDIIAASWILDHNKALVRDDLHTLLRALRTLDSERKGYIQANTLQTLLQNTGSSPFSAQECSAMERFAADDKGRIYYDHYAYQLANDGRK